MKVKGVDVSKVERLSSSRVAKTAYQNAAQASAPAQEKDDVELSSAARMVKLADEVVRNTQDIRTERIKPIQEALDTGRYSVSSLNLADKMLRQILTENKKLG